MLTFCNRGLAGFLSALLLLPATAAASGLRLTPLRLDLSAAQASAQVEMSNLGAQDLSVQVKAFSWRQENGKDIYQPTKDIFFAPPIVSVPAQGKTLIRFRRRGPVDPKRELAYRIYFQELPPPGQATSSGASYRIRFGVPLFVAPAQTAAPKLGASIKVEGERLNIGLTNSGLAHLKIQGIELYGAQAERQQPGAALAQATQDEGAGNYLLPGTRQEWVVKVPEDFDPARHQLLIRTDDYSQRAAKGMGANGWLWLSLGKTR